MKITTKLLLSFFAVLFFVNIAPLMDQHFEAEDLLSGFGALCSCFAFLNIIYARKR